MKYLKRFTLPRLLCIVLVLAMGYGCNSLMSMLAPSTALAQVSKPELVKSLTIEGEASALEVSDNNVFVAHRSALGEPQIIRIYLGDPARPKIEEHFNVPLDVRAQFVDILPKNGRIYAANDDGLWMSNNHYELDQVVVLEGAHEIADFGDNLIAVIGTYHLIFLDTARNNTQVGEFISATPLTALAVGAEHRAFVADSFNGGSVRSFRLMRPDEGWGVLNEGGVGRLGQIDTIARVGNRLWVAGPGTFHFLTLAPYPFMERENASPFIQQFVRSGRFLVEIATDWLHVIDVGFNGETNDGFGNYVATLLSVQDQIIDAQTLGADHLVVIHQRAELEIYRFNYEQEPTATAIPLTPVATPTCTGPNCPIVWPAGRIYLPIVGNDPVNPVRQCRMPRCRLVGDVCECTEAPTPRIGTPPANTPVPVPTMRPTGVATEEPRVPPTVQP